MTKVKTIQMNVGVDLIGSRLSMTASKNVELELLAVGVKMTSIGTGRVILIPFTNIKGIELFPEDGAVVTIKAKKA